MGTPNPNPIAEDTIRITVQLEVPYTNHDLMKLRRQKCRTSL